VNINSLLCFLCCRRVNFYVRYGSLKKSSSHHLILSCSRFKIFDSSEYGSSLIINIQSPHMSLYFSQYNVGVGACFNHNLFHLSSLSHRFLQGIHLGCSNGIFHIRGHCILIETENDRVIWYFSFEILLKVLLNLRSKSRILLLFLNPIWVKSVRRVW
jgi:hypothetical protein